MYVKNHILQFLIVIAAMTSKADIEEVNQALQMKADIDNVNDLLEAHTNDVNDALALKASVDDLALVRSVKVDSTIMQEKLAKVYTDMHARYD